MLHEITPRGCDVIIFIPSRAAAPCRIFFRIPYRTAASSNSCLAYSSTKCFLMEFRTLDQHRDIRLVDSTKIPVMTPLALRLRPVPLSKTSRRHWAYMPTSQDTAKTFSRKAFPNSRNIFNKVTRCPVPAIVKAIQYLP